jgi:hypothetical protein
MARTGRVSPTSARSAVQPTFAPYPQTAGLGFQLMQAQVLMLGTMLAAVSPTNQVAVLEALVAVMQGTGQPPKKERDVGRRQTAAMVVAAAALASVPQLSSGRAAGRGERMG